MLKDIEKHKSYKLNVEYAFCISNFLEIKFEPDNIIQI
jgi:hypothetical protein